MKMPQYPKPKGVIALLTVLIVTNILLITGIALVASNVDAIKSFVSFDNTEILRLASNSCQEEALARISRNRAFTGTVNVTQSQILCQAAVTNDANPSKKNIAITAQKSDYFYSIDFQVDISGEDLQIEY